MSAFYPMTIRWSPGDGCFIVDVPDLPGCFADGPTRAEAVRNAERVVDEWLDEARRLGRAIPTPAA